MTCAWTSPVLVKLSSDKDNTLEEPLTPEQGELIGSLLFLAAAIGPLLFMKSSDSLGRKRTLVLCLLPSLLGYTILYFSRKVEFYYVARILNGISLGPVCGLSQSYLSEIIFSAKKRGPYLAINSPAVQSGFLFSYIVGTYVSVVVFNGIIFTLTLVSIILIANACPESPYFILETKGRKACLNVLKELEADDVEKEVLNIQEDLNKDTQTSILSMFRSKENMKPFVMATSLLLLQQLSGIGILIAYSQQIFLKSSEILPPEQCSIVVGIIQVLSAITTTFSSKKIPRKTLLVISLLGSGFFDLVLGFYFLFAENLSDFNWIPLVSLILFSIFYIAGLDPLPWVYIGEIFPPHLKSVGSALSVVIYWICTSVLSWAFNKIDVSYLFFTFSASCFFGIFYVKIKLTETKDKTLREIQKELEC